MPVRISATSFCLPAGFNRHTQEQTLTLRIFGITWVGVTTLILWQPIFWSLIIMLAKSSSWSSFPFPSWEIGQFWQKTQRRLQLEKKMVPDPFRRPGISLRQNGCVCWKTRVWPGHDRSIFRLLTDSPRTAGGKAAILEHGIGFLQLKIKPALFFWPIIGWMKLPSIFCLSVQGDRREDRGTGQNKRAFDEIPASNFHTLHPFLPWRPEGLFIKHHWEGFSQRVTDSAL